MDTGVDSQHFHKNCIGRCNLLQAKLEIVCSLIPCLMYPASSLHKIRQKLPLPLVAFFRGVCGHLQLLQDLSAEIRAVVPLWDTWKPKLLLRFQAMMSSILMYLISLTAWWVLKSIGLVP